MQNLIKWYKEERNVCQAFGRIQEHTEFWWGTGMKAAAWKSKEYRKRMILK